ncbi:MAG: universal stress protein [Gammaproteobacteria bacterium]
MADKNVLVFPTDFSTRSLDALPWLRRMRDLMKAEIHVIYVVEEPQIYTTLDMGPVPMPSTEELVSTARERLASFVGKSLGDLGTGATSAVVVGRPADEIVAYAREAGASMLIMTTHGYSGVKHMLLGSTTEAVLRQANCPVLSIRVS